MVCASLPVCIHIGGVFYGALLAALNERVRCSGRNGGFLPVGCEGCVCGVCWTCGVFAFVKLSDRLFGLYAPHDLAGGGLSRPGETSP